MNRNDTLDAAKGLGMLFVILGHVSWSLAFRATYSFHMPLFFLIAGWLLSERLSPRDYFVKRSRALLPVYVFTALCMILLSAVTELAHGRPERILPAMLRVFVRALYGSGLSSNPTPFGIGQIGAVWFLLAMLESTAFVRWLVSVCRRTWLQALAVFLVFAASCVTARWFWLPASLQAGGAASLFVYLGWLAHRWSKDRSSPLPAYLPWAALGTGALAWAAAFFLDKGLMVCSASFPLPAVTIPLAILISCGVISLSFFLVKSGRLRRPLAFLGRSSLALLSFHLMELDYAPWYLLYGVMEGAGIPGVFRHLAVYALKVLLCVGLTLAAARIPFLKKLFRLDPAPAR